MKHILKIVNLLKVNKNLFMKKILLTAAIICLAGTYSFAQDSLDYFPAHPGDKWFYYIQYSPYQAGKNVTTVDSVSTDSLGRVIYISSTGDDNIFGLLSDRVVIDTTKGIVYNSYFNTKDSAWVLFKNFDLEADIGDYWHYYKDTTTSSLLIGVAAIYKATIWGRSTLVKRFEGFGGPRNHDPSTWFWQNQEDYAYGIGMIYMNLEEGEGWFLEGAIINGDTLGTILNVKNPKDNTPDKFELFQNYPNPFNPSTVIRYDLPDDGFVTLKVYDVLGREIATLVNEERPAGTYRVNFNGDRLSSGIYFYSLQTNGKTFTKKMLLVK